MDIQPFTKEETKTAKNYEKIFTHIGGVVRKVKIKIHEVFFSHQFSLVQLLSYVRLFVTP